MSFETIAAISTPIGESGLAVVRLSGTDALRIADRVLDLGKGKTLTDAPTHTVHYGHVVRDGKRIDEVLATILRAPRTFTREDMVEISCHGGMLPAKLILDALLAAGARLAGPGEFSKRAFLNGRIDLAQAEAIADLIHSRTELALRAANEQLEGKLSKRIEELREQLLATLAHMEAHIDFPDEDISPDTREKLTQRISGGLSFIDQLLRTAHEGQVLRRGIRAAIIGRPNAGKSSLLNHLLGHDRAIVSPIPGTTRDTIEETANIRGIPVVFVDTAGLRESSDLIEAEGIRRSHRSAERADLIIHVLDASETLSSEDEVYLEKFQDRRRILVKNKSDLPRNLVLSAQFNEAVEVSCATGAGMEPLKDRIQKLAWSGQISGEMFEVMINSRHQEALERARQHLTDTLASFQNDATLELTAVDLRLATQAVGEIVGKTTTEDLLDSIFGQFCIGK
ncbi:MAG: tRNA uridine-5-carboxymethylaminomethyl(34) synthesis GTPase MnmE [Verrucomicrobiota bacterium]